MTIIDNKSDANARKLRTPCSKLNAHKAKLGIGEAVYIRVKSCMNGARSNLFIKRVVHKTETYNKVVNEEQEIVLQEATISLNSGLQKYSMYP